MNIDKQRFVELVKCLCLDRGTSCAEYVALAYEVSLEIHVQRESTLSGFYLLRQAQALVEWADEHVSDADKVTGYLVFDRPKLPDGMRWIK
jgi:hypothetical protein